MVFPSSFLKVVASGSMLAGAEEWSCSWSLDLGGFSGEGVETLLDGLVPVISTWFSSAGASISTRAQLETIKANVLGVDGKYVSQTYTGLRDIEPVVGSAAGNIMPPQNTVAVSLRTARKRGPGARGRFYPPLPVVGTLAPDGTIAAGQAAQMATAGAALINGMNGVSDLRVVVASEVGAGALVPVTSVAVGTVVDTQRRRRGDLVEVYSTAAVAP